MNDEAFFLNPETTLRQILDAGWYSEVKDDCCWWVRNDNGEERRWPVPQWVADMQLKAATLGIK